MFEIIVWPNYLSNSQTHFWLLLRSPDFSVTQISDQSQSCKVIEQGKVEWVLVYPKV